MDYTTIGLQKNGKPEEVEEPDLIATVSGHLTRDEILEYAKSGNPAAVITAVVIALAFGVPGAVLLIKPFKGDKSAAQNKKYV